MIEIGDLLHVQRRASAHAGTLPGGVCGVRVRAGEGWSESGGEGWSESGGEGAVGDGGEGFSCTMWLERCLFVTLCSHF